MRRMTQLLMAAILTAPALAGIAAAPPASAGVTVAAPDCESYGGSVYCFQPSGVSTTWYITPSPSAIFGGPYSITTPNGSLHSSCYVEPVHEIMVIYDSYVISGVTYTSASTRVACSSGPAE